MKLRYIILHILMCLALAFIVPSCVDPVEDPEEIVDEDGDIDVEGDDEDPILDPEEASKYVSESAYKVAEYIKKNYSDSYSEEDFETIIYWLWNQDYVVDVEHDEYYRDIHSTFKDGTDFHIITVYVSEDDEYDSTKTLEVKSSSPNVYDIESYYNEIIQENNKILNIEGVPKELILDMYDKYEEVDIELIDSPLNIDVEKVSGLKEYKAADFSKYGAFLISHTHGIPSGSFYLSDEVWGTNGMQKAYNAVTRYLGLDFNPFVIDTKVESLNDFYGYNILSDNPIVYGNYCWSSNGYLNRFPGSFAGYDALTNPLYNTKLSLAYFEILLNGGQSHFDDVSYTWKDDGIRVNVKQFGEDYIRYFSISTDAYKSKIENGQLAVRGKINGYKNLKESGISYYLYYKEGNDGFDSPAEGGVNTLVLEDINTDGTIDVKFSIDEFKAEKEYTCRLGFEYHGNYYLGTSFNFTTPLLPTPGQWVDLGLSVKWAGWNVGASSPEEYGGFYAWGETAEKSEYTSDSYTYVEELNGYWDYKYEDIGSDISGTSYDVASVQWSNGARMPTIEEVNELVSKCTVKSGEYKGSKGDFLIGPNGNIIFLPFSGYCDARGYDGRGYCGWFWSGTDHEGQYDFMYYDTGAYYFYCTSGYISFKHNDRSVGLSVRPVR